MLDSGEIGPFTKVDNDASYSCCAGSKHLTNGKIKGRDNTKNSNKYFAWAYIEATNFAVPRPSRPFGFMKTLRSTWP